jgi:chromosome segregation ATPase
MPDSERVDRYRVAARDARRWRLGGTRQIEPRRGLGTLCLLLAAALASLPAVAQQPGREREAIRRAQQTVSRLQQENAALQREKLELQQKLQAAQDALAKAQAESGRLRRTSKALAAAEQDNAALRDKLAATQGRLQDTEQTCRDRIGDLRKQLDEAAAALETTRIGAQEDSGRLAAQLAMQSGRADACEARNAALFGVTMDLIDRYKQNRGVWEKFLLAEPFTQLKSVEVENLLDDMRNRARENKSAGASVGTAETGTESAPR